MHHREAVRRLDDEGGAGPLGIEVAPVDPVLREDVRARQRVARPERRVLDERGVRCERIGDGDDGGQRLMVHPDEPRGPLGEVARLRDDERHRLAVVVDLTRREDRPVLALRPEAGHGLRQVGRREDEMHARQREGLGRVDRAEAGPGDVEADERGVERVRDLEVRQVALGTGDPPDPADAVRRFAHAARRDGHWSRPSAFERAPTRAPAAAVAA